MDILWTALIDKWGEGMDCCGGGNKNSGNAPAGHGASGNDGQNGINWVQIVVIGIALLFLANLLIR